MKPLALFTILLTLVPALAQDKAADKPKETKDAAAPRQLAANQQAFLNLPEERRTEWASNLQEANRLFQQKRIFETLEALNKCEAIFKDSPETLNLRGACYVELRAFDKAAASFDKALTFAPGDASVLFNVGEIQFVTKQWKAAVDTFQKVLKDLPKNQTALSRLVEFKMMLCEVKLGKIDEAKKMLEKYDIMEDSPIYCFGNAAIAYSGNDTLKAEEWLARANRIFNNQEVLAPWQDTLVEFGYIKSFYGGDGSEGE